MRPGADDAKIDAARAALAAGEASVLGDKFKDAPAAYKDAVSQAEGA